MQVTKELLQVLGCRHNQLQFYCKIFLHVYKAGQCDTLEIVNLTNFSRSYVNLTVRKLIKSGFLKQSRKGLVRYISLTKAGKRFVCEYMVKGLEGMA